MFDALKRIFNNKKKPQKIETLKPKVPEALGLRLGGSFTIDPMLLKTMEPSLIIEGASPSQIIQAVGIVNLDEQHRLLRFYTDDEGFLQVLQYGEEDSGITEITLWYFYDAKPVPDTEWDSTLKNRVVVPHGLYDLEGYTFKQIWEDKAPVPLIETTYHLNGNLSKTTQFVMSYNRELTEDDGYEMLIISAEEKVNRRLNTVEHELVRSTGFMVNRIDITTN